MVAAGTTAALILFSRKWERHRDKKKQGSFNGGNVFRFFEAWGVGFFKTAMTIGQFKYPRTPACSQVDTYPGGYNVSDDGEKDGELKLALAHMKQNIINGWSNYIVRLLSTSLNNRYQIHTRGLRTLMTQKSRNGLLHSSHTQKLTLIPP